MCSPTLLLRLPCNLFSQREPWQKTRRWEVDRIQAIIPSLSWEVQFSLIIHGFNVYKFSYLLKFVCYSKINTCGAFMVIHGYAQSRKNVSPLTYMFPAEVKQGNALPSCHSSHTVNKCHFHVFIPCFSHFCASLVISLFKMAPKHKPAVMYLMEKMPVLDKLHSGMSYSAVGHELNINEAILYMY